MKRFVTVCLLLLLVGLAVLWLSLPTLLNGLRRRAEQAIADALHMPARIDALGVWWLPPHLHVGGVVLGTPATPLATLDSADLHLAPLASLRELRLVATIRVQSISFDVTQLPPPPQTSERHGTRQGGERLIPPFRI